MDGKKKAAGWLVLTAIVVVAAVALAVTNLATEGKIAERNLGEAQAALERMFPEADPGAEGFEELATEESGGLQFAYAVRQNGQIVGYAAKTAVQGYAGPVEVISGMDPNLTLRGIDVGGSNFQETEGLGSKARDEAFTGQFQGKATPLSLNEDIDAISGATITSRAVVEGVNDAVSKLHALVSAGGNGAAVPDVSPDPGTGTDTGAGSQNHAGVGAGAAGSTQTASASVIGYGGPVLVRLGLDDQGAITSLTVGEARFLETEGVGSRVREEAFTAQFRGRTPPLTLDDVDAVSGATVSSQAVVDAVNEAATFLRP